MGTARELVTLSGAWPACSDSVSNLGAAGAGAAAAEGRGGGRGEGGSAGGGAAGFRGRASERVASEENRELQGIPGRECR